MWRTLETGTLREQTDPSDSSLSPLDDEINVSEESELRKPNKVSHYSLIEETEMSRERDKTKLPPVNDLGQRE